MQTIEHALTQMHQLYQSARLELQADPEEQAAEAKIATAKLNLKILGKKLGGGMYLLPHKVPLLFFTAVSCIP